MSAASPVLTKVSKSGLCAGCGACAAAAPGKVAMTVNEAGFARPSQREALSAAEENVVANVCPSLSLRQDAGDRADHVLWGPYLDVYSGHAADERLRHHASSGGALSAFVTHLLESGAAKFVLQTAASETQPLGNEARISADGEDVYAAAGSRYAPSSPLADLDAALARRQPFVFVGKPCDAAALRALAQFDARINEFIVCVVTFFCAGVPSLKGAEEIVRTMGADPDDVVSFRYRGDGWPGKARATLKTGEAREMSYHDSWGKILTRRLQPRCKICPDGTGGHADISFADAWHCDEKGYPLFEEQPGRSLIVTRTPVGETLLRAACAAGAIRSEQTPVETIAAMQIGQVKRRKLAWSRLAALRLWRGDAPTFTGYRLRDGARLAGVFANLKSFLGTSRRVLLNKF